MDGISALFSSPELYDHVVGLAVCAFSETLRSTDYAEIRRLKYVDEHAYAILSVAVEAHKTPSDMVLALSGDSSDPLRPTAVARDYLNFVLRGSLPGC